MHCITLFGYDEQGRKTVQTPNVIRILVADDEQAILSFYQEIFTLMAETPPASAPEQSLVDGYSQISTQTFELVLCQQGSEAVKAARQGVIENRPFAIAFIDINLPSDNRGIDIAEDIRALDPHIEIVMMTGYSDIRTQELAERIPPMHKILYIEKPIRPKEIYQLAGALGAKWRTEREMEQVHDDLERWLEDRTVELLQTNQSLKKEIEARTLVQNALLESEERYRIVLESVPDPIIVYDMEDRVEYVNPAFSRVFGWTLAECQQSPFEFVPVDFLAQARLLFEKTTRGQMISGLESCRLTKDGAPIQVSISSAAFFDQAGKLGGRVMTLQDITARKKTEEEIKFLAYHDALSGLPNRKSFYLRLEDSIVQSQGQAGKKRRPVAQKWALLFLDVDRFKFVNDTLGHELGDLLLREIAARLQQSVRKSDYIFRLGGDEFTIILNAMHEVTDIAKVAQKIREEIAAPCVIQGHEIYVTASIGISLYPDDGAEVEELVKKADMAMYAAKEGKEGFRFFTEEMNQKAMERMMLEGSLRHALQDNQLLVYYQPLVDEQRRVVGTEALLRWQHPQLGLLSPTRFIPIAEETGAIIPIGKWVLYTACQQAMKWHNMGFADFYVAVNLSTRQFKEPDLVEIVEHTLETTGLPPHCLKLEVTESGIMENPERAVEKMDALRRIGVKFSIDDFGTGYSSLSYLKRFPISTLKIDRSFVMDAPTNTDDQEIIKTIIAMARNLRMETVAEGVETQEQQEFLAYHGCRMMQGFYFGRPMPAESFEELLHGKNE